MTENQSYHCLNAALQADYEALKRLKEKYASWAAAWQNEKIKYFSIDPEKELWKLEASGAKLILREDSDYPPLLKEIAWQPFGLYLKGELPENPAIAIVGTRKATQNGRNLARQLARDLSRQNIIIVSGLAMGIDEAAHQGAVEAKGKTIAVLPSSLERIYPAQNQNLARNILDCGGALISEYPPKMPTYPSNFVQRNRIVSGLSRGTVVIEAPEKSGALITAAFATEQNREVMAVPGPANHENYIGSHKLIRDGAKLVTSAKEILEEINLEFKDPALAADLSLNFSREEIMILETIKKFGWPVSVDKLSEITHIEVPKVNQIIACLIIKGILKE
jgi:DNA processing protein